MKIEDFLNKVSEVARPLIPQYGYGVLSVILAQGLLECGFEHIENEATDFKFNNFFGLKCGGSWRGRSFNSATEEEYTEGELTKIRDNFRIFDTFEDGVKGYFDFLDWSHYDNLKGITTPLEYVQALKDDGYATSSHYVNNIMNVIYNNNLLAYDSEQEIPVPQEEQPEEPQEQDNIYIVQDGDTLSQIAQDKHTTVEELQRINNIDNPDYIQIGQVIYLSDNSEEEQEEEPKYSTRSYTVKINDNLTRIAEEYNTSIEAILEANSFIENPNYIQVGWELTIPC